MKNLTLFCSTLLAAMYLVGTVHAQPATPSSQDMIEQLKAKPAAAPKTRSMRNLSVDAATAKEVAAEQSSLSLQIQFDFNSARIKPESSTALGNLATALQSKELLEAKFAIEGHTDAKGGADYNQKLSQQRANAVRDFLASKGVEVTRLSTAGKGSSELANKDDPLAAENRRVKIVNMQ
jgi:outer membrane protein OmpA-like peptidoglycan-associated protein